MALTPKQEMFANEYLKHFNATSAALNAGYSPKTAYSIGWENLRKPEIAEAISKRLAESAMGADEVLMRLADHARADIGRWLSDDGDIDIARMKVDAATKFVKKVKRTERSGTNKDGGEWSVETVEIDLYDAQAALVHIGRHHKLFTDVTENKTEIEIVDATDPRERIASRIAGIAERKRAASGTERPDDRGSDGS